MSSHKTKWQCTLRASCNLLIKEQKVEHRSWNCGLWSRAISKHEHTSPTDRCIRPAAQAQRVCSHTANAYTKRLRVTCAVRPGIHSTQGPKSPSATTAVVTEDVYGAKGSPPVNCISSAFSQPSFSQNAFLCLSSQIFLAMTVTIWMGKAMLTAYWKYPISVLTASPVAVSEKNGNSWEPELWSACNRSYLLTTAVNQTECILGFGITRLHGGLGTWLHKGMGPEWLFLFNYTPSCSATKITASLSCMKSVLNPTFVLYFYYKKAWYSLLLSTPSYRAAFLFNIA